VLLSCTDCDWTGEGQDGIKHVEANLSHSVTGENPEEGVTVTISLVLPEELDYDQDDLYDEEEL
jgi:hypothetical protein